MKQMASFLVAMALFAAFVGSRFLPSDGDHLAAIGRMAAAKVRHALPAIERVSGPLNALRGELPEPLDGRVRTRLTGDKKLEGVDFAVSAEGGEVKLRGIVPDAGSRRRAVELAESTTGVDRVIDEIATPTE